MPSVIVNGDAVWRSDKILKVQPPSFRAEYTNLLPLADENGEFEYNSLRVWADVYSFNRPDITLDTVIRILEEFEVQGLLERRERRGKVYGIWTNFKKHNQSQKRTNIEDVSSRNCDQNWSQAGRNAVAGQSQTVATAATSPLESTSSQSQNRSPMYPKNLGNLTIPNDGVATATETFQRAKRLFRRFVGKSIGSLGPRGDQWEDLVKNHGSEIVLSALELWAREGGKGLRNVNWPLAVFLKNAEEFIDAVQITAEETQQVSWRENAVQTSIEAGQADFRASEAELLRKRREDQETAERLKDNPFGEIE